jgi:hypothetical protein
MECNFQVGQKVVCVKSAKSRHDSNEIVKGRVYTVRHIYLGRWNGGVEIVTVCLEGHVVTLNSRGEQMGWAHSNFRPLVTTDISVFTAMLVKPPGELVRV